ncbi:globin domain-containing protein [Allonocardiopsis opalescens]|uniref:nitric oxide dioxygenase n=1 Tax=Allonocardiopsis opalescens TaxID=1144618 RepID=A0A2T0Q4K6_9ACTN|nr:globin domain-containing protein [Allonocardiopsis opalescens]PRX98745.1 NAD(P)H-flavin reductase [Allonocardiopsis opalescens]
MSIDTRALEESHAHIERVKGRAIRYFYGRLFAEEPGLRALFPAAMGEQHDRLFEAVRAVARLAGDPDAAEELFGRLGRAHRRYGVTAAHYAAFGRAFAATLRVELGADWTPELAAAWRAGYERAAGLMRAAAAEAAGSEPPWWHAEVLAHERRAHDLAVLTLRPHGVLRHRPGQHLTVQHPRWPRIWRRYSLAGAPRADGTVELHVRRVPGGWVSGALVAHTRPGDRLVLGPAEGSMLLDEDSARPLLCVAGGTGLAPVKALAEQAAALARPRRVVLVHAVRDRAGLYDMAALRELRRACPAVRLVPAPGDGPGLPAGREAALRRALAGLDGLAEYDACVSGPPALVRLALEALREAGVPEDRIGHELDAHGGAHAAPPAAAGSGPAPEPEEPRGPRLLGLAARPPQRAAEEGPAAEDDTAVLQLAEAVRHEAVH